MEEKLNFISVSDLEFYTSDSGLLFLRYKGEDIGRIAVIRMFPFMHEEEYIAIRRENCSKKGEEEEIGILRSLSELSQEQVQLVKDELKKRYFIPEIISVDDVKEEYGNTKWKTQTTAGSRDFTVADMGTNVRSLGNNRLMMTDVFGNRYYIPDITKTDDKVQKILEIWI